jgi:hypothetical protein
MFLYVTGLSSTNGTFGVSFTGTATQTTIYWDSIATKAVTLSTQAAPAFTFNTTNANTTLTGNTTATAGYVRVFGSVRIGASGGTFIPNISMTTAAACSIQPQSYFKIGVMSNAIQESLGNWS